MLRLPRRRDVWRSGRLRAEVTAVRPGKAPCWPAGTPEGWVLVRLENADGFCGIEVLPVAEFVVRYDLDEGGPDPVN